MKWKANGTDLFVRLDPGDTLVSSLKEACAAAKIGEASIVSGVGMLSHARLGFFRVENDDYDVRDFDGLHDLSLVCGNISLKGGEVWPHVHAVFNTDDFETISGHVIEATTHITMEVYLSTSDLAIHREKVAGCPATRLLVGDEST